jgi:limonene 1,2-monooxygenase
VQIGLFSNSSRFNEVPWEDYDADLQEIVAADQAGFAEVWISEHLGSPLRGAMPAPELLIAKASAMTEQIRLGAGVRLLPLYHPFDVATQAAVNDQLLRGRYNLGVGTGFAGVPNMERRGLPAAERIPRTLEAVEFIVRCFTSEEPFDFDGEFYCGRAVSLLPAPYQRPHPPMAVAEGTAMSELAAARGYGILFGHWSTVAQLQPKLDAFVTAAASAGVPDPRSLIRIARMIYVAEDRERAIADTREGHTRELAMRRRFSPGLIEGYLAAGETVDDLTVDLLRERGAYILGDPDDVANELAELCARLGGFGTLLLVGGKDVSSAAGRARSMALFASEVAPRLRRRVAAVGSVG